MGTEQAHLEGECWFACVLFSGPGPKRSMYVYNICVYSLMHSGGAAWLVPLLRTLTPHRVALATHFDAMGIFDVYFIWVLRSYDTRILQEGSVSRIRHVSNTDASWIRLGYVSNPYWKYWIRIHSDTCIGHVWTKLDTACEGPTSCVSAWRSGLPPHRIDDASMLAAALGTPLRRSGKTLDAQAVRQDTQCNICSLIYFFLV